VDLNDTETLAFYTELVLFKNDPNRETLVMPPSLSAEHRRTIHALAHNLNLHHTSHGTGEQRQVHIMKHPSGTKVSPPHQSYSSTIYGGDAIRSRGLNRAATTDFGEARQHDSMAFNPLRGQSSVGLLGVLEPSTGMGNSANLRAAKSFADLRSYTPSPVPSTASFPPALQTNGARFQQMDGTSSGTPTITPTTAKLQNEENQLSNGFGGLSLGTGLGNSSSPRPLRNMFSWERNPATAPIGSNRNIGTAFDGSQDRLPSRQPRGPNSERGSGFRRQNGHHGRGSDELRGNPEIIVE
jgi:R3H domain